MQVVGVVDEAVKQTAGLGKLLKKAYKFLIESKDLNEFWRTARGALDAVAGAAGVPLSQLRQDYRNFGVDPDKLDEELTEAWNDTGGPPDTATVNQQFEEFTSKARSASTVEQLLPVAALVLAGLMFMGRGRRGRGRGRGRFRMRRRGFRRFRRRFR